MDGGCALTISEFRAVDFCRQPSSSDRIAYMDVVCGLQLDPGSSFRHFLPPLERKGSSVLPYRPEGLGLELAKVQ